MTEDQIEQSTLEILARLGWDIVNGPTIGPDGTMERGYEDAVLNRRLELALAQRDEALKRIVRTASADLLLVLGVLENVLENGSPDWNKCCVNISQK